jgi:hypothetical protein
LGAVAASEAGGHPDRRWRSTGGTLILFIVVAVAVFLPAWTSPTTRWVGESGDTELYLWFLRWTPHALAAPANPLYTTAINHPLGVNLAWNTQLFLPGLVLTPITELLGPIAAYNVMVTAGLALDGWCAYLLARRFVSSRGPALAAGLLYELSPALLVQALGHGNQVIAFTPPLVALLLDDVIRRRRSPVRCGLLGGVLAAAQLYISEEMLATTAVLAAVVLLIAALRHRDRVRSLARPVVVTVGVAALLTAALSAPLLIEQFTGPRAVSGAIQPGDTYVMDALEPAVPTAAMEVQPPGADAVTARFTGNLTEAGGYVGVPLLVVAGGMAVRLRRRPLARIVALATAASALLSLGPHLHIAGWVSPLPLPWWLIERLPLLGNALPARLAVDTMLGIALLVALGLDQRPGPRRSRVRPAVMALVALTLLPALPFPSTADTTPGYFRDGGAAASLPHGTVLLVLPFAHQVTSSAPMLWQAESGMTFAMPEGYFVGPGDDHAVYGPPASPLSTALTDITDRGVAPALDEATRARLIAEMRALGVTRVVLGPMTHHAAMQDFLTGLLGGAPQAQQDVLVWTPPSP